MTKQKHFFLFRGLIREGKHWGEFPATLAQTLPNTKVTNIDIPGSGEFHRSPSPLSIKKMVERMRRVYLEQKVEDDECILIAISLGGMIAAEWLKTYPEDFEKVVLINTSYGGFSKFFKRLKPSAFFHLLQVVKLKGRAKEAHILRLVSNHKNFFDSNLDLWEEIQKQRPVSLGNTVRQLVAAARFRIGKFRPSHPVLLLASTHDRMVDVSCSRMISKKWDLPLIEHPTAGHDIPSDDPDWIVQRVKEFVC